ncbi:MAG: radical SAM protein [Deltaproteobacteria bacterium]|nr:radical SAM protein [Deltaproteobacteria bacterium]
MKSIDIVLIGYEPKGSENLTLRLLASAITSAGMRAVVSPVSSMSGSLDEIKAVVALSPTAIGFSLQDSVASMHSLALAGLARKTGYAGYIVCGGPFATLQTEWVLNHAKSVNGVIRHQGEGPLTELITRLKKGIDPRGIPGLATRSGPRLPSEISPEPSWRPQRGPRPKVLGIATADIISGRGCTHKCDYCTHAAVSSLAIRECRDSGVSPLELKQYGLDSPSVRPLSDLADEMAELYHEHKVRYFHLIDENPIPADEQAALKWAFNLKTGLDERNVGKIALGMMTRGDALTDRVIDELVKLGLTRTFVGIEAGTDEGLSFIRRKGSADRGRRALNRLANHGVVTIFNSLLLHPGCTPESIRTELSFLRGVRGALFETLQVTPFAGTPLNKRLADEGRLKPGNVVPGFDIADPAATRFASLLRRLRTEALGAYDPIFRAMDLLFSIRLLRKFNPNRSIARMEYRAKDLSSQISDTLISILEQLLVAAEQDSNADFLIYSVRKDVQSQTTQLQRLSNELENLCGPNVFISRQYRNIATGAAALLFAVSNSIGACSSNQSIDEDAGAEIDSETGRDTDSETDTCLTDELDNEGRSFENDRLYDLIRDNCNYTTIIQDKELLMIIVIDAQGKVKDIVIDAPYETDSDTNADAGSDWKEEMATCYMELLKDEEFPCHADEEVWMDQPNVGVPII